MFDRVVKDQDIRSVCQKNAYTVSPCCQIDLQWGMNSTTGRESSGSEFHVSRVKQAHNLEQDATTGSVGTFDRIVVKNGPTLTLIDKHAMFLLTVGANLDCSNEVIVLVFVDCRAGSKYPCRRLRQYGERLNRQSKSPTNASFRNMSEWILPSKSALRVLFWIPGGGSRCNRYQQNGVSSWKNPRRVRRIPLSVRIPSIFDPCDRNQVVETRHLSKL
jgi:hypothetical protein